MDKLIYFFIKMHQLLKIKFNSVESAHNFFVAIQIKQTISLLILDMKFKSSHSLSSFLAVSSCVLGSSALPIFPAQLHVIDKREVNDEDEYTISNIMSNFGVIEWIGFIIILWAILMLTSAIIFLAYKFLKTNKDL